MTARTAAGCALVSIVLLATAACTSASRKDDATPASGSSTHVVTGPTTAPAPSLSLAARTSVAMSMPVSVSVSAPVPASASTDAPGTATLSGATTRSGRPKGDSKGSARRVLPRGGTSIIGRFRVVAHYGAHGTSSLGVLGEGTPEQAARAVLRRAKQWTRFGRPVQPAMELISTVAQRSAGPDGDYSNPVDHAVIRRYLAAAHRHKMLLILDLQPGRASFVSQARDLHSLLHDPSVGLGLDPEWKVGPDESPGDGRIGSSSAADVNATGRYLARVIRHDRLPDKLLVVHDFTPSMLPDRENIRRYPGVEVTFHADGFGSPGAKRGVYRSLNFPGHPFGTAFKLFLTEDQPMLTPRQVLRLRPRPDIVTYQ